MRLSLPCPPPKLAAVIGGGGKTTLLFKLGRQLAASGAAVLLTTTTHLAWPPPADVAFCAPSAPEELAAAAQPGTLVLAGYPGRKRKDGRPFAEISCGGTQIVRTCALRSGRFPALAAEMAPGGRALYPGRDRSAHSGGRAFRARQARSGGAAPA